MVASPVVIALYRSLLLSARQLQHDIDAGRTLYNAVRSGAVASYAGVKSDWQRERLFVHRFDDLKVLRQTKRAFAAIVRSGFVQPVDEEYEDAVSNRTDAAFKMLRGVDDHNSLVEEFTEQGLFQPKIRSHAIEFLVGDVVEVKGEKRGVIFAWHVISDELEDAEGSRVVYDILPHSPGFSFASKLYNVPQDEIRLDESPKVKEN
ncbi:hypothetical protein BBO99_00003482 [Phytophthora kernoviae]|uniref:Uncharacterized protein n=2 Tax=Phytophthora kernoviae TaxID=325452 RepID=A0A421EV93_9STRA|nr:hypothetical protein G195_007269 [Phytophthora kernoviae 00238/432]KAG2529477.1 hypothetical protein JM18_002774 [Phytophthora kernoviae]RLN02762.1 hypothetical protein BBI17_003510 [Phytophthora kernoviae]RLN81705.1 hypothetical protein BBO99_00003482 [Phytophthora kernoviae]